MGAPLLGVGPDPPEQAGQIHRAGLPRDLAAVPERDQRRYAADAEARRDVRLAPRCRAWRAALRGASCAAACSYAGAIIRHGPHQGAQKSTTSGRSLPATWRSKLAAVELERTPGEQRLLAAAAIRARVEAFAQHAIGRVAVRDRPRAAARSRARLPGSGDRRSIGPSAATIHGRDMRVPRVDSRPGIRSDRGFPGPAAVGVRCRRIRAALDSGQSGSRHARDNGLGVPMTLRRVREH